MSGVLSAKMADGTIVIHGVGRVESIGFALAMPTRAEQIERVTRAAYAAVCETLGDDTGAAFDDLEPFERESFQNAACRAMMDDSFIGGENIDDADPGVAEAAQLFCAVARVSAASIGITP